MSFATIIILNLKNKIKGHKRSQTRRKIETMQGNEFNQRENPRANIQAAADAADEGTDIGDVESIDNMSRVGMNNKCKIHPTEDIKAFDMDDLCSICFKCLMGAHRNHEIVMLDELQVEDLTSKVTAFQDKVED